MAQRLPVNEQVVPQQVAASAPANLGQVPVQGIIDAGAAIGQQLGAIVGTANELEDFSYEQEAEFQLRSTQITAQKDVQERLMLPDGDERAFFDAQGNYRPVVIRDLMFQYGKNLASLDRLPLSSGRRAQVTGKVAQAGLGLIEDFTFAGLQAQQKRAIGNFENNYKLALETGNYEAAELAALDGARAGLYSQKHGELLAFQARKAGMIDGLNAMLVESPRTAIARLNSGEFDQYTTPAERAKIRRDASRVYEQAARQAEKDALVFTAKDTEVFETDTQAEQIRKRLANSPIDGLPRGTATENAHWKTLLANPGDQQARSALLNMAELEACSQKPGATSEAARDEFMQRYTRFGIFDESAIARIWKEGQTFIKEATSVSINAETHIDAFFKAGDVYNEEDHAKFMEELNAPGAALPSEKEGWFGWGENRAAGAIYQKYAEELHRKFPDDYPAGKNIPKDVVKVYAYNAWLGEHEAQKKAQIMTAYNAWRHTEDGKKASPLMQRTELDAICERVLGRSVELGNVTSEESLFQRAKAVQEQKAANFGMLNQRTEKLEPPSIAMPVSPFKSNVRIGFAAEGDKLNLNEIRLPASMLGKGVKEGSEILIQSPSNGRQMLVKIAGTSEAPQLSDELAVYLQIAPGETRTFDMKVVTPAAAERLRTIQDDRLKDNQNKPAINAGAGVDLGGLGAYREVFEAAGQQNGVDPNLLLAIAMHETGLGRSRAFRQKNNAMGISNANGPTYQTSVAEGVHRMASLIGNSKLYRDWQRSGKLADLQKVYAPVGANNDQHGQNQYWQDGVRKFYKQLTGKELS